MGGGVAMHSELKIKKKLSTGSWMAEIKRTTWDSFMKWNKKLASFSIVLFSFFSPPTSKCSPQPPLPTPTPPQQPKDPLFSSHCRGPLNRSPRPPFRVTGAEVKSLIHPWPTPVSAGVSVQTSQNKTKPARGNWWLLLEDPPPLPSPGAPAGQLLYSSQFPPSPLALRFCS